MTRQFLLVGVAALSLTLAACGQKSDQTDAVAPDANPAATIPTPTDETSAPEFVAKAAAGDMFEVEAGKIAMARSANAEVKAFARMMVTGHTKTTADLKAAIAASGLMITPPATLPDDKATALADLRAVDAAGFDRAYMTGQVDAHQATLNLVSRYAQDGDTPQIKAAAAAMLPVIQEHLDKARTLRDSLS
jgi:putative membrane protein